MTLDGFLKVAAGGGVVILLLTCVEVSRIKINPWSAIRRLFKWLLGCLGRATNGDVLEKLEEVSRAQQETQKKLDELERRLDNHIKADDNRDADDHRMKILQFNNELLRDIPHTKEMFIEVLTEIDYYEDYCREHEDYSNNRAVLAIENIQEVYRERLKKHDFLEDGRRADGKKETSAT